MLAITSKINCLNIANKSAAQKGKMKNLLCSVLMIALSAITNIKSLHEIHFDRIELVNRTEFPGIYKVDKLRVKKFNRTAFVIDADFEIIQDIDERFSVTL